MENFTEITNWAMTDKEPPVPTFDNDYGSEFTDWGVSPVKARQSVWKETTLFPLLPEEIWLKIFADVEDKKDWESCCMVFSHVCSSLSSTKPLWRFGKAIGSIAEYLPVKDLLNCRLVCTQWRDDVDTCLQSRPIPSNPSKERKGLYTFTSIEQIHWFIEKYADHPTNPLLDRSVTFKFDLFVNEIGREVDTFMNQFGPHIWYLNTGRHFNGEAQLYKHLHTALTKATNLKHLKFDGDCTELGGWEGDQAAYNAQSISFLRQPPPFLPTLESLWLDVMYCGGDFHSLVMLPYAAQLKSFSMNMQIWQDCYARGLVNLRELVLEDIGSDEKLEKLLQVNSPIERISLSFGVNDCSPSQVSLTLVMKVLGRFPLLREIVLLFGEHGTVTEPEEGEADSYAFAQIRLPKVRKLRISQGNKFSFEFLKCFPNLETLIVEVEIWTGGPKWKERRMENEGNIQFYKMWEEGGVYKSNIWSKLPKLKSVRIFDNIVEEITTRLVTSVVNGVHTLSSEGYIRNKRFDFRGNRAGYEEYRQLEWFTLCSMFASGRV